MQLSKHRPRALAVSRHHNDITSMSNRQKPRSQANQPENQTTFLLPRSTIYVNSMPNE